MRNLVALFSVAAALVAYPALGTTDELTPPQSKIVNGVYTFGFPTVGYFLNGAGQCSGTLIGCSTFLTAAHCVCTDPSTDQTLPASQCQLRLDLLSPSTKSVFFQHAGWYAVSSVVINPNYTPSTGSDFALLHLATPVSGIAPMPINTLVKPAIGTLGLVAGFGTTRRSLGDTGIKRAGTVVTSTCNVAGLTNGNMICWNFAHPLGAPGTDSDTCAGDSGGPLLADVGAGLTLAGVTSAGTSSECTPPDQAWDADVFRDRAWIQTTAGTDLGTASCGGLPAATSPNGTVLGGVWTLSASTPELRTSLEVPSGASRIRVSLNGEKPLSNDYDLYLQRNSPPSTSVFDCKSATDGSLEFCEVNNPQSGTWHILANYAAGVGGLFQVTATVFSPPNAACVRDARTACLQGDRFEVKIAWQNGSSTGLAQVMTFGDQRAEGTESAFYYFQSPTNFEMGIKVLNACIPIFGNKYWVFISGLTDQGWTVTIRDTQTNAIKTYSNAVNHLSSTFADVAAFSCQ